MSADHEQAVPKKKTRAGVVVPVGFADTLDAVVAEIKIQVAPGYNEMTRMYATENDWHIAMAAAHIIKAL